MADMILVTLLQASILGAGHPDFDQALHRSLATGRPLVVLIGATWCPACQKMKNSILPRVAAVGGLNQVVFTYVDFDQQQQLASHLSRAKSIPQLIRFDRTASGWKSKHLVGARSQQEVYDFINAGLNDKNKASKLSLTDRPQNDPRRPTPRASTDSIRATSRAATYSSLNAPEGRQRKAGQSPRTKDVGADGSVSGGNGTDIAASLSTLVSGWKAPRRDALQSNKPR